MHIIECHRFGPEGSALLDHVYHAIGPRNVKLETYSWMDDDDDKGISTGVGIKCLTGQFLDVLDAVGSYVAKQRNEGDRVTDIISVEDTMIMVRTAMLEPVCDLVADRIRHSQESKE